MSPNMLYSDMKQNNVWPYNYSNESNTDNNGGLTYNIEHAQADNIQSQLDQYGRDDLYSNFGSKAPNTHTTDILHDTITQNIYNDGTNLIAGEGYNIYPKDDINHDACKNLASNTKYDYENCVEDGKKDLNRSNFEDVNDGNVGIDLTSHNYQADTHMRWNDNYPVVTQENTDSTCSYMANEALPYYDKSTNGFQHESNLGKVDAYINKTFQNHFNNYATGNDQRDSFRENINLTQLFSVPQNNYLAYDPNPQYVWNNNIGLGLNSQISASDPWGNYCLGATYNNENANHQRSAQIGDSNRVDLYDMVHDPYSTGYFGNTMTRKNYCHRNPYPNQHDYASSANGIPGSQNMARCVNTSDIYPVVDSNSLGGNIDEFDFYNKYQSQYNNQAGLSHGYYNNHAQKPMQKFSQKSMNYNDTNAVRTTGDEALENVLYRGNLKKIDLTNIDFIGMSDKLWQTLKGAGMFKLGNKGRAILKSKISKYLKMHPEMRMRAGCISGVRRATTRQLFQLAQICQITSHLK
ncbi:hypothetical protein BEWA_031990 [Theileria equi strain WA]|uniref:Uncharacterized protein n=1 Tax=Theileria equi strain WA TaxID=1537102 RepID=L0AZA4_THEEQ|nr:hypothetical protein BEWA_031990 [Theileria equi strain WA]AFZ80346.1 hypothetical protein BEWA_031990 [Theileria equi strain WA]|eukprot:XP_004830012.1 hypothetical protein BEWA_031990 [Theileria equi strain WA]